MVIQLSGCAVFWTTAGATLVGNIGAELIMEEVNKEDDKKDEAPQP